MIPFKEVRKVRSQQKRESASDAGIGPEIAFDEEAQLVVPFTRCQDQRRQIDRAVRSIQVAGGTKLKAPLVLARQILPGQGRQADLTPKDLLKQAQDEDPVTFAKWTPHRVASTLKRYGLLTHKTGRGRRSYHQVKVEQLRRVARAYGFSLSENASFATNATPITLGGLSDSDKQSVGLRAGGEGGDGGIPGI